MPKLRAGEKIKRARKARGWSRATLAQTMGIHPETVRNWERGTFNPNRIYRQLVEKVLGIDLSKETDPPRVVTFDISIGIEGKEHGKEQ